MSRTRKDRPAYAKALEKVKQGKVEHDHKPFAGASGWYELYRLGTKIPKGDTQALKAFEESLTDLGTLDKDYRIIKTEIAPQLLRDKRGHVVFSDGGNLIYTPRMIEYVVHKFWTAEAHDGECVVRTGYSNRGPKRFTCYPIWAVNDFPSGRDWVPPRPSKAAERKLLQDELALALDERASEED